MRVGRNRETLPLFGIELLCCDSFSIAHFRRIRSRHHSRTVSTPLQESAFTMTHHSVIVTIDGPAGTGKSTVARQLAAALGFEYLDTGAMYRMIALLIHDHQIDPDQVEPVGQLAEQATMQFQQGAAYLNGVDVSHRLRSPQISATASIVAQNPAVRDTLVQQQRDIAENRNIVCEGRDQGTIVFPDANYKFFLTAAPEVRAFRRMEEMQSQGKNVDFEQLLEEQNLRDERDSQRKLAPLKPADDAVVVDTTHLSIEEVVRSLEDRIRHTTSKSPNPAPGRRSPKIPRES